MGIGGVNGFDGVGKKDIPVTGPTAAKALPIPKKQVIKSAGKVLAAPTTEKIYEKARPKVLSNNPPAGEGKVLLGAVTPLYSCSVSAGIEGIAAKTIGSARAPSQGLSGPQRRHIQATVSHSLLNTTANWGAVDFASEDFNDKIKSLVRDLIQGSAPSGITLGKIVNDIISREVLIEVTPVLADREMSLCYSTYVQLEGDISPLENFTIHKHHELQGGRFGNMSRQDLAKESYTHFGVAIGQSIQTTDPKIIAAEIEKKGCGKTLDVETKQGLIEEICNKLNEMAQATPKIEKEKISKGNAPGSPLTPVGKESHLSGDIKAQKEEALEKKKEAQNQGVKTSSLADQKNLGLKQVDINAKRKNEENWAENLLLKLRAEAAV